MLLHIRDQVHVPGAQTTERKQDLQQVDSAFYWLTHTHTQPSVFYSHYRNPQADSLWFHCSSGEENALPKAPVCRLLMDVPLILISCLHTFAYFKTSLRRKRRQRQRKRAKGVRNKTKSINRERGRCVCVSGR